MCASAKIAQGFLKKKWFWSSGCRQGGKFIEGKVVAMCNMVVKEVDETMFMNEIESTNALGSWLYGWKGNLK